MNDISNFDDNVQYIKNHNNDNEYFGFTISELKYKKKLLFTKLKILLYFIFGLIIYYLIFFYK